MRIPRHLPRIIAGVALLSLLVVSAFLWFEVRERFPKIEPGRYLGTISVSVFGDGDGSEVPLYLENISEQREFFIHIPRQEVQPQLVQWMLRGTDTKDGEMGLPISLVSESGQLKFVGKRDDKGGYSGSVYNVDRGLKGRWKLRPADLRGSESPESMRYLQVWLSLKAELHEADRKIAATEKALPEQEAEIEKLRQFVGEGVQLKRNADRKLEEEKAKLEEMEAVYAKAAEEVLKLKQQYELAQRLTPMGKLVALSRESLEREGRWIEAVLKGGGAALPLSEEMEEQVKKGERVLKLRREIELEKRKFEEYLPPPENPSGPREEEQNNEEAWTW